MNTDKTKNRRTAKPKHVVSLAKPKKVSKSKIEDCATVVQLPECNSAKTPCICKVGCQDSCQWACQSLCKFGCKPSEKAPPPPAKGVAAKKKGKVQKKA